LQSNEHPEHQCSWLQIRQIQAIDDAQWKALRYLPFYEVLWFELLTCEITHPSEQLASAPGKMYLFMKRPLEKYQSIKFKRKLGRIAYQMRSSYCQWGRIPATWNTKIPSSSSKS
jgi:hypothetical protein